MKLTRFVLKRLRSISLAELLVVLVISGLVIGAIRYLFLRESGEWRYVLLQVDPVKNTGDVPDPSTQWLLRQIKTGDSYYSSNGKVYAETVAVQSFDVSPTVASTLAIIKLRGVFEPRQNRFLFENRRVSVGEMLTINFSDKLVEGKVLQIGLSLDEIEPLRKNMPVTLRLKLIDDWLTDALVKRVPFTVRELNTAEVILEIESATIEVPSYRTYSTFPIKDMRSTALAVENDYRDLVLSGTITLDYRFGQWYFAGNQPVKIGSIIQFSTPEMSSVNARIQDITFPKEQ